MCAEPPRDPPGESPQAVAQRLFRLDGVRRSQVAAVLRKNTEFSSRVAQEYLRLFHFQGMSLEQALRQFLQALVLSGETQERERVLGHFSRRFHCCNPTAFPSADAVHALTCALLLLNTDLHGQRLGRAMSSSEFVANLSGMMDGRDFPREQLKALYGSIRSRKLECAVDSEASAAPAPPECPQGPSLCPAGLGQLSAAAPGPSGALSRKLLCHCRGRRAPWGRRGWKHFQAELRGAQLLWGSPGEPGGQQEPPLGLPHALALPHPGYTKRPNVFRLQAADGRSFLCQATSAVSLRLWVRAINLRAALSSAPPLPPPVGSRGKFHRATLPSAPSTHSPEQQLCHLRRWLQAVSQEVAEHQRLQPEGRRDSEQHREHGDFLLQQRRRCQIYVTLLQGWLQGDIAGDTDDDTLDDILCDPEGDPGDCPRAPPALAKAHSSPSLAEPPPGPPGPPGPAGRVRRHISERRATRSIVPKRHRQEL